jgi:hypothetical protein
MPDDGLNERAARVRSCWLDFFTAGKLVLGSLGLLQQYRHLSHICPIGGMSAVGESVSCIHCSMGSLVGRMGTAERSEGFGVAHLDIGNCALPEEL